MASSLVPKPGLGPFHSLADEDGPTGSSIALSGISSPHPTPVLSRGVRSRRSTVGTTDEIAMITDALRTRLSTALSKVYKSPQNLALTHSTSSSSGANTHFRASTPSPDTSVSLANSPGPSTPPERQIFAPTSPLSPHMSGGLLVSLHSRSTSHNNFSTPVNPSVFSRPLPPPFSASASHSRSPSLFSQTPTRTPPLSAMARTVRVNRSQTVSAALAAAAAGASNSSTGSNATPAAVPAAVPAAASPRGTTSTPGRTTTDRVQRRRSTRTSTSGHARSVSDVGAVPTGVTDSARPGRRRAAVAARRRRIALPEDAEDETDLDDKIEQLRLRSLNNSSRRHSLLNGVALNTAAVGEPMGALVEGQPSGHGGNGTPRGPTDAVDRQLSTPRPQSQAATGAFSAPMGQPQTRARPSSTEALPHFVYPPATPVQQLPSGQTQTPGSSGYVSGHSNSQAPHLSQMPHHSMQAFPPFPSFHPGGPSPSHGPTGGRGVGSHHHPQGYPPIPASGGVLSPFPPLQHSLAEASQSYDRAEDALSHVRAQSLSAAQHRSRGGGGRNVVPGMAPQPARMYNQSAEEKSAEEWALGDGHEDLIQAARCLVNMRFSWV